MDWLNEHGSDSGAADAVPVAPLGALRAVLAAAERLGVARSALLAAVAMEGADLDEVDRVALAHLRPQSDGGRARQPANAVFAARVGAVLTKLFEDGRCGVEDVAKELAVSPRTLQRRLEKEGTTFGAVCDETRRATALAHLRNPRVPIKEAAFLLGFSEPSTFYRAFRRWTGDTPANYRRAFTG